MHALRLHSDDGSEHCDGARAHCDDATGHAGARGANVHEAIVHSDGAHFHKVGAHFHSAWESLQTRSAVFSGTYNFASAHDPTERPHRVKHRRSAQAP